MSDQDLNEISGDVAIIGMACKFPEAKNTEAFWQNLINGIESIRIESSNERNRIKAAGILDNIGYFDANYFGYSPREAEIMDPQQRMMLECAVEALEDSGYATDKCSDRISVYLGSAISTYLIFNLLSRKDLLASLGVVQVSNGNDSIATSISYKLNFKGPSFDISTTCSSSLVAVHQACRSLLGYESDIALAGGSSINVLQEEGYVYQEGSILSADGHCRPFDHKASGTVEGSGLGLVVLKRLEDALQDHDHIYAVIKGSAINNDGADKIGYTAPSLVGQANVIAEAHAIANITADKIGYVEAHGTGTILGDPIEISALTQAFGLSSEFQQGLCAIGSVKANIGHLNTAAGVAGLIKTTLALKHRVIPKSLNYQSPNPQIDFANSPFVVNTVTKPWISNRPRFAAVSSFGMGGTNAHVVLQEAPTFEKQGIASGFYIYPLSAKNHQALHEIKIRLAKHLSSHPEQNLSDVAYTLQIGRQDHRYRCMMVVDNVDEAVATLQSQQDKFTFEKRAKDHTSNIIFMFPGQGSQYVNMSREIYETEPIFRAHFDHCCKILASEWGINLKDIIFSSDLESSAKKLNQTAITQPAIFTIEYALAKLLQSQGVTPHAMIGHSVGEYVAACLAGVFELKDALKLIAMRGKLIQSLPEGIMLAVPLSRIELNNFNLLDCSIAAINSEKLCVLSGPKAAIEMLQNEFSQKNIETQLLHTSHAFHSSMLDEIMEDFKACFKGLQFNDPKIPFISNVTGDWIAGDEVKTADYWVKHLRETVNFWKGLETLNTSIKDVVLVEVGPGQTLSNFSKPIFNCSITILPHPKAKISSEKTLKEAIGKLWLEGIKIDWQALYQNNKPYRVSLPTYAFQRDYFWIEKAPNEVSPYHESKKFFKQPIDQWFYIPLWKKTKLTTDIISKYYIQIDSNENLSQRMAYLASEKNSNNDINIVIDRRFQEANIYELLEILQQIIIAKLTRPTRIIVITSHGYKVHGTEKFNPTLSMIQGFLRAFSQEFSYVKCTHLDVDPYNLTMEDVSNYVQQELSNELNDAIVAIRHKSRWVQYFEQVSITSQTQLLKQAGVYIITGGLGNLGLIIAHGLFQKYKAKLVLISRTMESVQEHTSEKFKLLKLIENQGGEVLTLAGDVSDPAILKDVYLKAINKFGNVDGIIHAAGTMQPDAFTTIENLTIDNCNIQFKPKIEGLNAILLLMDEYKLDFCCLFSSISSQLSGLGHGAYSAANLFMDSIVQLHDGNYKGTPLISINWDAWFHGNENMDELSSHSQHLIRQAIHPAEGVEAFFKALNSGLEQIIIATTDFNKRIKCWMNETKREETLSNTNNHHDRPNISIPYTEPRDDLERQIATMFTLLLGVKNTGIHDNFFELGGHSLLATQLASRIREDFDIDFSLQCLFNSPTIAGIANVVLAKKTNDVEDSVLEMLLEEIKN